MSSINPMAMAIVEMILPKFFATNRVRYFVRVVAINVDDSAVLLRPLHRLLEKKGRNARMGPNWVWAKGKADPTSVILSVGRPFRVVTIDARRGIIKGFVHPASGAPLKR